MILAEWRADRHWSGCSCCHKHHRDVEPDGRNHHTHARRYTLMKSADLQDAALVNEGADHFGEGKYEAALVCFWQAFRRRPSAPVVLFNIARAMEELKDPRCEDFYAAAATQGNVDALYQLAALCVSSNRTEEAVEYLRAYLKGNPQEDKCTQWARQALHRLNRHARLFIV